MTTPHTPAPWYTAKNSNDFQGLIISETNGANVAVTYASQDAQLVSAAPDLLAALESAEEELRYLKKCSIKNDHGDYIDVDSGVYRKIEDAIQKAKGQP